MTLTPQLSRTLVATLAVAGVLLPGVAGAAPAPTPNPTATSSGVDAGSFTWAVQPSGPDGPTGRNYFVYDLQPGTEITDQVRISNLGDRPLTLAVYGTDAFTTTDGAFALLPASEPAVDVGSWVSFATRDHTVAPGRHVDIPFRLTVAENATPGDHAGGVVAAVIRPGTDAAGRRVNVDRRVAARVYLRVSGEVRPAIDVESMTVRYDNPVNPFGGGDATVSYRLRNSGNIRIGGTGSVTVNGPLGWRLARTDLVDLPELLPGGAFTVTERITGVPPALRLTAEVDLAPTTVDAALPPVLRSVTVWAPPWLLLAGLLLLLGWLAWRSWRRRREPPVGARPPGATGPDSATTETATTETATGAGEAVPAGVDQRAP